MVVQMVARMVVQLVMKMVGTMVGWMAVMKGDWRVYLMVERMVWRLDEMLVGWKVVQLARRTVAQSGKTMAETKADLLESSTVWMLVDGWVAWLVEKMDEMLALPKVENLVENSEMRMGAPRADLKVAMRVVQMESQKVDQ